MKSAAVFPSGFRSYWLVLAQLKGIQRLHSQVRAHWAFRILDGPRVATRVYGLKPIDSFLVILLG